VGHGSPTTTTPSTTTTSTTTTTTLPPLIAPSGLTATGGCQVLVIGPEMTLTWTASPTTRVSGYEILRGPNQNSLSPLASVNGRTTVTYTDTTVSGIGTTYWYEVEAVAGGSTAASAAASGKTTLCL
jgi:hypothetical protein